MLRETSRSSALQNIDLKLLRVFSVIVECDGFSAAQYDLNMSLSAISAAMSQLETRLGFKLCERGRSGFQLTEGGKLIYSELQSVTRALNEFQTATNSFKGDMHGQVSIAMDDAILTNLRCPIYKVIHDFAQAAPNLALNVVILTAPQMETALLENDINIAVGPFRDISSALKSHQIYLEKQLLCCGPGHPAFGVTDANELSAIVRRSNYASRSYTDAGEWLNASEYPNSVTTTKTEAMLALVLSGQYVGYLPRHFCESWIEMGEIWPLVDDVYSYDTPMHVVYKKGHQDPRIKLFLNAVSKHTN